MIRIDWINVAFVVIIVGGLLLIAATAQGAPRCPGVDSRTPRALYVMRRRILTAMWLVSTATDESSGCRLQPAAGRAVRGDMEVTIEIRDDVIVDAVRDRCGAAQSRFAWPHRRR